MPREGLEPSHPKIRDFESLVSTISPSGHKTLPKCSGIIGKKSLFQGKILFFSENINIKWYHFCSPGILLQWSGKDSFFNVSKMKVLSPYFFQSISLSKIYNRLSSSEVIFETYTCLSKWIIKSFSFLKIFSHFLINISRRKCYNHIISSYFQYSRTL